MKCHVKIPSLLKYVYSMLCHGTEVLSSIWSHIKISHCEFMLRMLTKLIIVVIIISSS